MRRKQLKKLICYGMLTTSVFLLVYSKLTEIHLFGNGSKRSVNSVKSDSLRTTRVVIQTDRTTSAAKTIKKRQYPRRPGCTDYSHFTGRKERRLRNLLPDSKDSIGKQYKFLRSGSSFSLNLRRKPEVFAEHLDVFDDWWRAFTEMANDLDKVKKDYHCPGIKARGNWWDCNSRQFVVRKPCLVYSFGIDNDFRFDDDMAKIGCEVHSFDPSMTIKDHRRETGVYFHNIGIGSYDNDKFQPFENEYTLKIPNNTWTIRTLASIMSSLGHENRTLDILKLDIEGYEWHVLENIICENLIPQIKQLVFEIHIYPNFPEQDEYVKMLQVYQALWHLDFKRFYTLVYHLHRVQERPHLQADVAFVNLNYNTDIEM